MTVSRVINDAGNVNGVTRRLVLDAIGNLNFIPNVAARRLATGSTSPFLICCTSQTRDLAQILIESIRLADARRVQLLPLVLTASALKERRIDPQKLAEFAAALVLPPLGDATWLRSALVTAGIPSVAIGSCETSAFPRAHIDEFAAAAQMTEILIERGHRSIAYIDVRDSRPAKRRRAGFESVASARLGRRQQWHCAIANATYRDGMNVAHAILEFFPQVTAIFAGDDIVAAGVSAAIQRLGLRVPEDISIVGFGDGPMAETTFPELTTVRVPYATLARQALMMLMDSKDSAALADCIVPHEIVHRHSLAVASHARSPGGKPRRAEVDRAAACAN